MSLPDDATLATVTTADYLPGTLVLIESFLAQHPGFPGRIAVIHSGDPGPIRSALAAHDAQLVLHPVGADLADRLQVLGGALPDLRPRLARFHSLEAFRLSGPGPVLFCDSDVLVQAPLGGLVQADAPLVACGDLCHRAGQGRDAESFAPVPPPATPGPRTIAQPFNAGVMVIGAGLRDGQDFVALADLVTPDILAKIVTGHTDQAVLNRHFRGPHRLADPRYNCLLAGRSDAAAVRDVAAAALVHFNGPQKPWHPGSALAGPSPAWAAAYRAWAEVYARALVRLQLHRAGAAALGRP